MNKYIPVIGLEVHVELKTKSKMFCGCDNNWFAQEPNTHTCPVCLGLPGALPVPNRKAIEWCVMIGMALNCGTPLFSKFDRKNYFYPDLAKGYQISQYDQPSAVNGHMILTNGKKIGITRVHMEEDTGKLIHQELGGQSVSLIDFNRSGAPLVEIVTEPDFDNAKDVKEYLQRLQQIVRYLEVSDADMEKGHMRLEPNISLRKPAQMELPHYKVEVKNINSFSFVEKAITYELKRQEELLEKGETPKQETRGWHEQKQKTISQRSKEEAMDYRYFPEPDIPPFRWTKMYLETLRDKLPELPDMKIKRFVKQYQLPLPDAEILTRDKELADFYEETVKVNYALGITNHEKITPKSIANWIINKKIDGNQTVPAEVIKLIIKSQTIEEISEDTLQAVLRKVITDNAKAVEDYKKGKETVMMFLVGMGMKELKGKAKADQIRQSLITLLKKP